MEEAVATAASAALPARRRPMLRATLRASAPGAPDGGGHTRSSGDVSGPSRLPRPATRPAANQKISADRMAVRVVPLRLWTRSATYPARNPQATALAHSCGARWATLEAVLQIPQRTAAYRARPRIPP